MMTKTSIKKQVLITSITVTVFFVVINMLIWLTSIENLRSSSSLITPDFNSLSTAILFLLQKLKLLILIFAGFLLTKKMNANGYFPSIAIGSLVSLLLFTVFSIYICFALIFYSPPAYPRIPDREILEQIVQQQKKLQISAWANELKKLPLNLFLYSALSFSGGLIGMYAKRKV